ncbi:MAG: TadE/TadG family type IV pilus assembly protein [Candidatus Dormibacteria bacterium]
MNMFSKMNLSFLGMFPRPRTSLAARNSSRAQVAPLFALMLPVIVALMGLSVTGEIYLNAKSSLDQATITASLAASGDACMSSTYSYEQFNCQGATGALNSSYQADGLSPLPFPPTPPQVLAEHQLALQTAQQYAASVLQRAIPQYTLDPTPCPEGALPTTCEGMLTTQHMVYQVNVSYQYYYDYDDIPSNPFINGSNSDDANSSTGVRIAYNDDISSIVPECAVSQGWTPTFPWEPNAFYAYIWNYGFGRCLYYQWYTLYPGQFIIPTGRPTSTCYSASFPQSVGLPGYPPFTPDYKYPGQFFYYNCTYHNYAVVGPASYGNGTLVCPATNSFAREIQVKVWVMANEPFSAFIGQNAMTMFSQQTSFGCIG